MELADVQSRKEALERLMSDAGVFADKKKLVELSREYKRARELVA